MPRFEPFPGVRYDTSRVDPAVVTAPPYDVLDDDDRAELAAAHEANVVMVDLPRSDDGDPYEAAASILRRWLDDGVMIADDDAYYAYRMTFDVVDGPDAGSRRSTIGVIGALELSAPGEGGILPHERTTPKAKSDRLQLTRATRANLSPIWGLSPTEGLSTLLDPSGAPLVAFTDAGGVTHELWSITDVDDQTAIRRAVESSPVVIADGHHRFETTLAYRDEQRAAGRGDPGDDLTMMWIVELVEDQLTVLPIHRVLSGMPDGLDLSEALAERFEVLPAADAAEAATRSASGEGLGLVTTGGAWILVPRAGAFEGVRDLDSSRLDAALDDLEEVDVAYQHGADLAVRRVRSGEVQAAVLLRPATVGQIVEIAHGGERMPPKTTFFHPKPRTGMVVRTLDSPTWPVR